MINIKSLSGFIYCLIVKYGVVMFILYRDVLKVLDYLNHMFIMKRN